MDYNLYLWVAIAAIANATVVILTKYFSTDKVEYMIVPYMIGILTTYAFLKIFRKGQAGILYGVIAISTLSLSLLGTYFFLKEDLSWTNIIGVIIGITAIYFLTK